MLQCRLYKILQFFSPLILFEDGRPHSTMNYVNRRETSLVSNLGEKEELKKKQQQLQQKQKEKK